MHENKKLNDYFDNIYCLNRDCRVDRWSQMSKKFEQFNISVERFSAYDGGSDLVNKKFKDIKNRSRITIKNIGEMGCLVSHYKIIEDAMNKGYESILVLEDDVMIHKDINQKISILSSLKDWDAVSLGCSELGIKNISKHTSGLGYYIPNQASYGTFAYAIKKQCFKDLYLEFEKFHSPADIHLIKFYQSRKSYVIYPNLIIANVEQSDIRSSLDQESEAKRRGWVMSDYI